MNTSRPGYSDEFVRRREADEAAAEAQRQADAAENQRLRNNYLAGLAAKRAADTAENEARLEAALAPERIRLERQWLADHPDRTRADFLARAWPQLRQNLGDERAAEHFEEQKAALRKSGAYNL